jgi:CRP-like cAMP-binding protein
MAATEKYWRVHNCNFFANLSPEELRELESVSRARKFPRKSPIYLPADEAESVFLLTSGRVTLCHITPEGKQSILAFIEPGEMFGELALLGSDQREEFAEANQACTVVLIPRYAISKLMEKHADLTLAISKMIGLRRRRIERRLRNLLFLSNRERLTHLLLELTEQYGRRVAQGIELTIKLSHQELASVIGSTRETVTVVLGELQEEGLIQVGRRKIIISQMDQLAGSVMRESPDLPTL